MSEHFDPAAFLESSPLVPIVMSAADALVLHVGQQAADHLGFPVEDWTRADFWDRHVLPDDQGPLRDARSRSTRGGTHSVEFRMEHADGRVIWTQEVGRGVRREDGTDVIYAFLQDVTDRKRQEVTLWKNEERLRAVLRSAPDAMVLTDVDGRVVNMNDQAESLFGYRLSDIVGSYVDHLLPDRLRGRLPELRAAFDRDPARRSLVDGHGFAIQRVDGTEVPVEWSMSLVPGPDDSRQILCSVRDLTVRRRVEAQLRSSERQLHEMANVVPAMVCVVDRENRYRFANDEYARWYGWERHQIDGRLVREVVGAPLFGEMSASIDAALSGLATHKRGEISNPDGDRLSVDMSFVPQQDEEGAVTGYFIVIFDVTAEVAGHEAELRHREELAHVARVATMGELAASIAHELNQPLSAIVANAEAGRRLANAVPPDPDELADTLSDIASDGRRAGEVIASMRQLLQRGESRHDEVDIARLVLDSVELVRSEAIGRGVTVRVEGADADTPRLAGDEIQLKQVLLNLLVNAIEAAGRRAAEPRFVTAELGVEERAVVIAVRDSGPGLPGGDPEELFTAFVSKRPGGLGMGLSISRTIVDAHGGWLWAEPNQPGGAAFFIRLPRGRAGP